jgi:hypothetical protein
MIIMLSKEHTDIYQAPSPSPMTFINSDAAQPGTAIDDIHNLQ